MDPPRFVRADDPGPFTLDGTRTYLVGRDRVAVIDPGPALTSHVEAVARAVEDAREVVILQTHDHADHAGAGPLLARRLEAPVLGGGEGAEALPDGTEIETDRGRLVTVATPGHADPHLSFHWPAAAAVFVGDLLLGEGSTTWLGAYPGCMADFFDSLDRIEALAPTVLYPAHGPPLRDVADALDRYRGHRRRRLVQLRNELERNPEASTEALTRRIYGSELPDARRTAAARTVQAMLHHLRSSSALDGDAG